MIYNNPFFGFPFTRRYPFSYSYYQNQRRREEEVRKQKQEEKERQEKKKQQEETNRKKQEQDDVKYFEIMGIRLYLDDILIICLLFFLYNEGVEDQSLFISLILLLLS